MDIPVVARFLSEHSRDSAAATTEISWPEEKSAPHAALGQNRFSTDVD